MTPEGGRSAPSSTSCATVRCTTRTGILYGRLPGFRLSANGRDQADVAAKALVDADLTAVLASPLQRAQETADPDRRRSTA